MKTRHPSTGKSQEPADRRAGNRAASWLRSLARRITIVTTAVAVLAVLVTVGTAFPLIRSAAIEQARQQLSRQANAFAAAPAASQALDLRERHLLGPDTYELSTLSSAGTISGPAAQLLDPAAPATYWAARNSPAPPATEVPSSSSRHVPWRKAAGSS